MSEVKHTPGDWVVERGERILQLLDLKPGEVAVSAAGGEWYGFATVITETEDGSLDEQGEANLRLILAAPKLLASLKEMVSAFWGDWDKEEWRAGFRERYPDHHIIRAEAVLRAIEGGS